MQKILITGSSGLLGSYVVPLLRGKCELHLLQRNIPVHVNDVHIHYHETNLSEGLSRGLPTEADAIIYLAQSENFRNFPDDALEVFNVNTIQVLRLLDYGKRAGIKNFIFASTGGVYPKNEILREGDLISANGQNGFYAATKICSEILADNYSSYFNTISLRFFFIYGKGQKRSMLLPRLVDSVINESPVNLTGESGLKINPVHASDAAKAVLAALNLKGSHKINVAGKDVYSLRQICEIIGEKINKRPQFNIDTNKDSDNLIADISLMKKHLVEPIVSFEEGVIDLI